MLQRQGRSSDSAIAVGCATHTALLPPEVPGRTWLGVPGMPVEVKYRSHIDFQDTRGLRSFIEKSVYNAPFGVLVTQTDDPATNDPRIVEIPLTSLLMMR